MGRHFTNWIQTYLDYTNDMESPTAFHFWTAIATVAGALRRRVWIDMSKFTWTPNFYIILVAPAGIAAKSTSISIGMDLLSKLPKEVGIRFGPESMTWQKLADSLSEATEYVKYINLVGAQALQPMSAITCAVSELGTFINMEDDKLLSFLIRMWDGGDQTFIHSTKASGNVEVKAPWLNIIAATTPAWLSVNFPIQMIGGGLASRILFVHQEEKRKYVPYPDEITLDKTLKKKLIEDLHQIALLAGPYTILEDARQWGRDWYIRQNNGVRSQKLASDRYSGYLARKQTHLHKVAMVWAAAQREELIITRTDLIAAEQLVTDLEEHMIKTFNAIGEHEISRLIKEIYYLLRGQTVGWIRHDELMRHSFHNARSQTLKEALQTGVDIGLFTQGMDTDRTPTYALTGKML